jgi:hypothetical protein
MEKYKYHLRPGYGSKNLLIEVFYGAEHEPFLTDSCWQMRISLVYRK